VRSSIGWGRCSRAEAGVNADATGVIARPLAVRSNWLHLSRMTNTTKEQPSIMARVEELLRKRDS